MRQGQARMPEPVLPILKSWRPVFCSHSEGVGVEEGLSLDGPHGNLRVRPRQKATCAVSTSPSQTTESAAIQP